MVLICANDPPPRRVFCFRLPFERKCILAGDVTVHEGRPRPWTLATAKMELVTPLSQRNGECPMTSREGLIARQEDAIVRLHEDTQSVPEHPDESRATDNDKCVNLSEEIIADNLRMIAKLRGVIARVEDDD
jgi:hypothetical protein